MVSQEGKCLRNRNYESSELHALSEFIYVGEGYGPDSLKDMTTSVDVLRAQNLKAFYCTGQRIVSSKELLTGK